MKTEFLKNLGITEQSVIDAIMAENGKDVNSAKGDTAKLETQVSDLQSQLNDRDSQLTELKNSVKDNEKLTNKITELENANKDATAKYESKIAEMQKTHATESEVRNYKAKNVKAVMALLDHGKIDFKDGNLTGIKEQLDELVKSDVYLFESVDNKPPVGTVPSNPPANGGTAPTSTSLADAVAKALGK